MARYFTVDDQKHQQSFQCGDDDTETKIIPMLDAVLANLQQIYQVIRFKLLS